jgi:hypothetical protein
MDPSLKKPGEATMIAKDYAVALLKSLTIAVVLSSVPHSTLGAIAPTTPTVPTPSLARLESAYGHLPLSFEANYGQWDPSVQFATRGRRHQLFLTPSEAVLALRTGEAKSGASERGASHRTPSDSRPASSQSSVVRMTFEGANPQADVVGLDQLPGIVNYFIGDDPTKWRTNIPTYQKVAYKNVYEGIDLVYYGNQGQLEYDLIVAPGADPSQIRLAFNGAEKIAVDGHGDLVLTLPQSSMNAAEGDAPTVRLHKPVVYQMGVDGEKHFLPGSYVLLAPETASPGPASAGRQATETPQVAFHIASYDASQPLIIDPVLSWATYLGGSGADEGHAIAVDQAGNAYVTGETRTLGSGFPGTAGSLIQSTFGGENAFNVNAFVTKLNAAGTALIYSTYLGGSGDAEGFGIAVDQAGNAYVTGGAGPGFPGTSNSLIQSTFGGPSGDAFVTKLNAAGTALLYSTYLGGSGTDEGHAIAVDQAGQAYVTGIAGIDFPGTAASPIQSIHGPDSVDAFVTKLNAAGTALLYSTYLGGSGEDVGSGIAVDGGGNAYVTGTTGTPASGFPGTTASLIQSTHGGGVQDAFVTKLNASGTALLYSTYLGGNGSDSGLGIAVDQAGNAYVTGGTRTPGSGFPGTAGSLIQSTRAVGGQGSCIDHPGPFVCPDAFVTKLNATGTALLYSTYLGGNGPDFGTGIAVDQAGNAYVTGFTGTPGSGFPGTAGSLIQSALSGTDDAFVTKLNATGTAILYSTYLGGSRGESGDGIAVDQVGNAYVTGRTSTPGSGFPGTSNSLIQSTFGGEEDAFVAKISSTVSPTCSAAQANPAALWSPNHQFVPITITGVTDPSGLAVKITVTGVTQDEPVNAKGDGNTSPDAVIHDGAASVRAERSGNGNGRVYQLSFKADNGQGGVCTGTVKVSVPHSMHKGATAIDDGQAYDSTVRIPSDDHKIGHGHEHVDKDRKDEHHDGGHDSPQKDDVVLKPGQGHH